MTDSNQHIPQTFSGVATPGVLVSNSWPTTRETEGATLDAINQLLDAHPELKVLQTVDVSFPKERARIAEVIKSNGITLTSALTRILGEQKLNLSDLDQANRMKSVGVVIEKLAEAYEMGVTKPHVISGPGPADPGRRGKALEKLADSLMRISEATENYPGMKFMVEPLDYKSHKKCALGTADECVAICKKVWDAGLKLYMCLDTAHMILNGENSVTAINYAMPYLQEYHFCNPVTDLSHPQFGDNHLPIGAPGALDVDGIGKIMAGLYRAGYFSHTPAIPVLCEVWKPDEMTSMDVVEHALDSMNNGWKVARKILLQG